MNNRITAFSVAALVLMSVCTLWSRQLVVPGDVSFGHVHLRVSDIAANKNFWVAIGGTPVTLGSGDRAVEGVAFGDVRILFSKGDNIGPAIGSTVNHIGFYVPNVKATLARWKDMGLKTENGRNDQQGWVWTPGDLIRFEILEMPGQTIPMVFHHVHLFVAANDAGGIPEAQGWYTRLFAAAPGKRAAFDIVTVAKGELSFSRSDTPTAPSAGRAVDHIGFLVKNLEAYCRKLEANGIKLDTPYTRRPDLGLSLAFLTDPWGTRIELNEPLTETPQAR